MSISPSTSIRKSTETARLTGDVTLSEGSNITLTQVGSNISIAGSASGAPANAQYVVLSLDGTLTDERVLTPNATNLTAVDNGAGGTYTLNTIQNIHTAATPQFARMGLGTAASATTIFTADNGANAVPIAQFYDNAVLMHNFADNGAVVFNENGNAVNFRIESDTEANMFFIDGTNNRIGSGTATPRVAFDFVNSNNTPFILQKTSSTGFSISSYWPTLAFNMYNDGSTWRGLGSGYTALLNDNPDTGVMSFSIRDAITSAGTDMGNYVGVERLAISRVGHVGIGTTTFTGRLNVDNQAVAVSIARFLDNGTLMHEFADGGGVVFNENGNAVNFRVESDTDVNNIFSDGTNNRVGIGTASPGSKLDVVGSFQCDSITNDTGLAYGVYSPTRSAEVNMDANVTMTEAQYMRVGNTVTVSGRFTADPTLTATATSFEITLPVASNFGAVEDAAGTAFCGSIAAMGAEVTASVANNTLVISWISSDITSQSWSWHATYQVI